jgi:hypothetical protein
MWYHTYSMCPPRVTRQTSMRQSSSDQHIRRDRVDSCSRTDGRPESPFLWSQMHPFAMKFLCHIKTDLLLGGSTLNLRLKAGCTVITLFVLWNSSTHQPRCCEVSAILHFTALWRRAGKFFELVYLQLMYLQLMYLQLMYLQLMYLQLMYLQLMYLKLTYLKLMYLQLMYLQLMYLQLMYL